MRRRELMQTDDRYQEVGDEHDDGQVADERDLHRGLEREHRHQREQEVDAQQGLEYREGQGVGGKPALPAGRQALPRSLEQGLYESLAPAGALFDELPQRRGGLLTGYIAVVVDDADLLPGARQA